MAEMEFKGTPGNWSIITEDDGPIEISVDGSDSDSEQVVSQWVVVESETHAGFLAAVIDMNYPNSYDSDTLQANANLIAAAPDLLSALIDVTRRCGPNAPDGIRARAAIAKALQS